MFGVLGRQPQVGDHIMLGGRRIDVLDVDNLRIKRVRVFPAPAPPSETAGDDKDKQRVPEYVTDRGSGGVIES